jgi:hypothetical protein
MLIEGASACDSSDGFALYSPISRTSIAVNETARLILSLCDGDSTPEQIAHDLSQQFDRLIHQTREDVKAVVGPAERHGFIRWVD